MLNPSETEIYNFPVSIITIPRKDFWLFKGSMSEIMYSLADKLEGVSDCESSYKIELSNSTQNLSNLDVNSSESESDSVCKHQDENTFFHLGFTPEEVTLMCSTKLLDKYLRLPMSVEKNHKLINHDFFIVEVFSDGSNIGKRILELTKPLAQANISLFFISNYFSDLVLIPMKDRELVLTILNNEDTAAKQEDLGLQIDCKLDTGVELVMTGARSGDSAQVLKEVNEYLCRMNTEKLSNYFALTLTPSQEVGLLLTHGSESKMRLDKSQMIGSLQDWYNPIVISDLPLDSMGIVSGIADKLQNEIDEMSYLSFGKSGLVLVPDTFASKAQKILYN